MTKNKKMIRKTMIAAFIQMDEKERSEISKQLQEKLFESKLWEKAQTIGVYLSIGTEWDTRNIVEQALLEGKNVAIPKTNPESKRLSFYQIQDLSQTTTGNFDLVEPIVEETVAVDKDTIDLLLVPGLVFTKNGYRVGFGGGYYDRYLTDFIHSTASLVHTNQIIENFPIEPFDIPVNYLITEEGIKG